jgi:hypothetical protein
MLNGFGALVMWLGFGLMLLGGVLFLVAAFREGMLWGLGVLFLPLVSLIFLILAWPRAKGPFFLQLYGLVFILLGVFALSAHFPFPLPGR